MTVSESIIRWLKTFDPAEYGKMRRIDTDMQSAEVKTYSLVKEPVRDIKSYITGEKIYTDHYMIQARLSVQGNAERIENIAFGELLSAWVEEQDRNGVYPEIEGAKVSKISITTPFYLGVTKENDGIYNMTIAIKYVKES